MRGENHEMIELIMPPDKREDKTQSINSRNVKSNATGELIKEKAKELFFKYGLKSVSLDDIAQTSHISKKTIYKFFDDKNAIVQKVVEDLVQSHDQIFKSSGSTASDAIDEVLRQDGGLSSICKSFRPSFFYELERFFPISWKDLEQYKSYLREGIINNLLRGQKEGNYKEDIDIELISDLRMHQLINVLQPETLTSYKLSITRLAGEFTMLYLRAITTEKGKKLLDQYLSEKKGPGDATLDSEIDIDNK